jgi:hypothetical protein
MPLTCSLEAPLARRRRSTRRPGAHRLSDRLISNEPEARRATWTHASPRIPTNQKEAGQDVEP